MAEKLPVRKSETLFDEIRSMRDRITRRAHEIFGARGGKGGSELEDWVTAERELVWKPALEMEELDGECRVKMAVPGIDAKELDVQVDGDRLLVRGEKRHEHSETRGRVHVCELESASVFRSVDFPRKVDPSKTKAELKNGMLVVTARFAGNGDADAAAAKKPRSKKSAKLR